MSVYSACHMIPAIGTTSTKILDICSSIHSLELVYVVVNFYPR